MLDAEQQRVLAQAIQRLAEADRAKLDALRQEVRSLRNSVRPIQPRTVTAISLMATDGGENVVQFDPYLLVPVRVVDSYGKPHFLDVLSPTMDIRQLNETQFEQQTPLGILMSDLEVRSLWELSPMGSCAVLFSMVTFSPICGTESGRQWNSIIGGREDASLWSELPNEARC
jgi:hypothetical protein